MIQAWEVLRTGTEVGGCTGAWAVAAQHGTVAARQADQCRQWLGSGPESCYLHSLANLTWGQRTRRGQLLWQHGTLGRSLGCFALHPRCGPWPQRCKVTRAFKFIELVPSYFPRSAQETSRQLSWKGNLYIFCKNSNHIIDTGDSSFLNEDCDESQESFLKKVTRACFLKSVS